VKVFVDANVAVDLLTQRHPHGEEAAALFRAFEDGRADGFVSALTFAHVAYLVEKTSGAAKVHQALRELRHFVSPLPVGAETVELALKRAGPDFEDDLQAICAEQSKMDCIVTRDVKDFGKSKLPVYGPKELLRRL
jgi:predicted nucleic acid-binding protein